MYKVKTISEKGYVVTEPFTVDELVIAEGASPVAPEGKVLTMIVNHVGTPIKPGKYLGTVEMTLSETFGIHDTFLGRGDTPGRAALHIVDDQIDAKASVADLLVGGEYSAKEINGVRISTTEEDFVGIAVDGDSEVVINDLTEEFEGDGSNDFVGMGAGVLAVGNAKVTINDSRIRLTGVTRCTVHSGGHSVVTVNHSELSNYSGETTKMAPNWCMGISGTNRSAQIAQYATVTYNDCLLRSNGWGVVSVDGNIKNRVKFNGCNIHLTGPRARGYGAYCIGDCHIDFEDCDMDVNGFPLLMTSEDHQGRGSFRNCRVHSNLFGILAFRDDGSTVTVDQGTVIRSDSSVFCVKGSSMTINVDNASLLPKNGTILQLMDNNDPGMGADEFWIPVGRTDVADPERDLTRADPETDVFLNLSHCDLTGNVLNSTTNLDATKAAPRTPPRILDGPPMPAPPAPGPMGGPEAYRPPAHTAADTGAKPPVGGPDAPDGEPPAHKEMAANLQKAHNLAVSLKQAKLTGAISSAREWYRDGLRYINASNSVELHHVSQAPAPTVNNGVIVCLDAASVWTVTETSYITSLTLADGALVQAPKGKKLTVSVDDIPVTLKAGTCTGKIVLTVTGE